MQGNSIPAAGSQLQKVPGFRRAFWPGVSLLAPAWSRLCLEASWTERRTSGSFLEPLLAPGLRKWLFCRGPWCLGFHQRGNGGHRNVSLGSEGWILPTVRGSARARQPAARVSDPPASLPPSPSAAPLHPVTSVTAFTTGHRLPLWGSLLCPSH